MAGFGGVFELVLVITGQVVWENSGMAVVAVLLAMKVWTFVVGDRLQVVFSTVGFVSATVCQLFVNYVSCF